MAKLEDLTAGSVVNGLVANEAVEVVAVKWHGDSVLEITYKTSQGKPGIQLVYREDESRLDVQGQSLAWSFDANADELRLVSEAYRIHLAHLFDSVVHREHYTKSRASLCGGKAWGLV